MSQTIGYSLVCGNYQISNCMDCPHFRRNFQVLAQRAFDVPVEYFKIPGLGSQYISDCPGRQSCNSNSGSVNHECGVLGYPSSLAGQIGQHRDRLGGPSVIGNYLYRQP
jgi:hypothetical protein